MIASRLSRLYLDSWRLSQRARAKLFSLAISRSFASFGAGSVIQPPLRLAGEARMVIGSGVFIGSDSWLQVIENPDSGNALFVGAGTSIAGHCVLSAIESIVIGPRVLIARNVYVADHTHGYTDAARPIIDQPLTGVRPVEISAGAWLGQNVVVCPGVRVGTGAVVGANSVVLDDVPDYAVAVGAPARVVRTLSGR